MYLISSVDRKLSIQQQPNGGSRVGLFISALMLLAEKQSNFASIEVDGVTGGWNLCAPASTSARPGRTPRHH